MCETDAATASHHTGSVDAAAAAAAASMPDVRQEHDDDFFDPDFRAADRDVRTALGVTPAAAHAGKCSMSMCVHSMRTVTLVRLMDGVLTPLLQWYISAVACILLIYCV